MAAMRLWEIVYDRLDEMAFRRKAVIDKLRAWQTPINSHVLKMIVWPDIEEVRHWKSELIAWGDDLAAMRLRGFRGVTPMGFRLAWEHLYEEPFAGAESDVLRLKLGSIQWEYQRSITMTPTLIMAELTRFLRPFCEAFGQGQSVETVVVNWSPAPAPPPIPEGVTS
jgi:hypothetical protein